MGSTRMFAVVTISLGVAAMVVPYFFGKLAVMVLGGVVLAGGVASLLFVNDVRNQLHPVTEIIVVYLGILSHRS